jgi:hypothetical protein
MQLGNFSGANSMKNLQKITKRDKISGERKKINMKAKIATIIVALVIAVGGVGLVSFVPANAAQADAVNVTVNVDSPQIDISVDKVNGINAGGVIETYNANNSIVLDVVGIGVVTIKDQDGNVLYQYNKTTAGSEQLTADITLLGGVGTHQLTAEIDGPDGVRTANVTIIYKAVLPGIPGIPGTPSMPSVPGAPDTGLGYIYIAGRAIAVSSLVVIILLLAGAIFAIWFVARRRKQRESQ